jgi:hypothetical protein
VKHPNNGKTFEKLGEAEVKSALDAFTAILRV